MSTAEEGWREGQAGDVGRTSLEDVILETRIQLSHLQKRLEEEADRLQQERRQVEEERARMAAEREAMQKEREAIEQERQAMRFQVKEYEAVIKELQKMNAEGGPPAQRPPSVKRPRAGSSSSSLGAGSSSSSSPGAAQTTPGYRRAKKHQQMLQAEGMPVVEEEQACEAYMGYLFDLTCIVTAKAVYEAFSCLLKPSRWDDAPQQERQKFQAQFMDIDKYGKKQDDWFLLHLKYIFKEVRKSEKEILWAGDGSDDDEEAVLKRAADHVAAKPAPARTTKAHRRKLGGEEDDDDEDSEDEEEDDEEEEDDVGMLEGTVRELAGLLYTKYLLAQWMKYTYGTTAFQPAYLSSFTDLPAHVRTLCLANTRAAYEWQLESREQMDKMLANARSDVEHLHGQFRSLWAKVPEYRGEVLM